MGFVLAVAWSHIASAAINVDRTRIIMDGQEKAVSVTLNNDSRDTPFLAQSWVDDDNGKRTTALMVLPPLQRIDGGQKAQVRIMQVQGGGLSTLPQDRETLFWFNVRGVPPKPDTTNVLQLALQSRLKLFYLLSQKPVLRKRLLGHIPIATLRPRQDEIFSLMTTSVSHIRHPVKAK
ncbi:fimbria/pilus periplasmic chaperone [Salmonella enterica]|nr:fimbria/pilus periplasmic chaperone [Salmonella enterica]